MRLRPRLRYYNGRTCPWCERVMNSDLPGRSPTRDHHPVPRSRGGTNTMIICFTCNNIKADMSVEEWDFFRRTNPEWWLTHADRKARRAHREKQRAERWGERQKAARVIRQAEQPSTPMADALRPLLDSKPSA